MLLQSAVGVDALGEVRVELVVVLDHRGPMPDRRPRLANERQDTRVQELVDVNHVVALGFELVLHRLGQLGRVEPTLHLRAGEAHHRTGALATKRLKGCDMGCKGIHIDLALVRLEHRAQVDVRPGSRTLD